MKSDISLTFFALQEDMSLIDWPVAGTAKRRFKDFGTRSSSAKFLVPTFHTLE